jgi:hypothetical protein
MTIEIFDDIEQGTDRWFQVRKGIPTASRFGTVSAKGRDTPESLTRRKYMLQLAGEIISGEPMESYSNRHMQRGKDLEAEAREFYAFLTDSEPVQVGFIKNGEKGASPDSLIAAAGMLEIKTCLPDLIIEMILKADFPPKFKAQVQGQLWVAEREWTDLFVYYRKPPSAKTMHYKVRAYRESAYIRLLSNEVDRFNNELADVVERVRAYGV